MSWHAKFYNESVRWKLGIPQVKGWYCFICNYSHPYKVYDRKDCPEMRKLDSQKKTKEK